MESGRHRLVLDASAQLHYMILSSGSIGFQRLVNVRPGVDCSHAIIYLSSPSQSESSVQIGSALSLPSFDVKKHEEQGRKRRQFGWHSIGQLEMK